MSLSAKQKHAKYMNSEILAKFKALHGKPNVTREKRAIIKEINPLYLSFGDVRPVWKSYETYAWNMGLLESQDD